MERYTKEELDEALQTVESILVKCKKIQPKFKEGTSQHTLLRNRIKAMQIVRVLLQKERIEDFSIEDLTKALSPVTSIIHKCEKAQSKFEEYTLHYQRFQKMLSTMYIAQDLIQEEIGQR